MQLRRDDLGAPFRARWAALVAVVAGLLGVLAFPRFGLWPVAVISVAGLSVAVHGRRCRTAAWLGLLYGAAFFVPLLSWTGAYVGPAPWLILAGAEAGYYAGAGALLTLVQRLRAAPLWIGAVWVLTEAVRDRGPFGGFPWGRLAFSQADSPLLRLAAGWRSEYWRYGRTGGPGERQWPVRPSWSPFRCWASSWPGRFDRHRTTPAAPPPSP